MGGGPPAPPGDLDRDCLATHAMRAHWWALELAREARLELRQDEPFGPIVLHPTPGGEAVAAPGADQPA